jgi:hypothetical protein
VPFIRRLGGPRFGRPGLLGTVARTAVIAGTATVTANAVSRHGQQRAAEKEAYAEQQQAPAAPQYAPPPPPAAAGGGGLVEQLTELAKLKEAGALTDAEYAAAKAQLLS